MWQVKCEFISTVSKSTLFLIFVLSKLTLDNPHEVSNVGSIDLILTIGDCSPSLVIDKNFDNILSSNQPQQPNNLILQLWTRRLWIHKTDLTDTLFCRTKCKKSFFVVTTWIPFESVVKFRTLLFYFHQNFKTELFVMGQL